MRPGGINAFVFSCKTATAAVVAYLAYMSLGLPGITWAPVSAVIVTQASLHPSLKASFNRIGANIIGAILGALFLKAFGANFFSLGASVLLTGLVCHFARMDEALRPAYASVVIVLFTSDAKDWTGPSERVLAVILGCFCALVVSYFFDNYIEPLVQKGKRFIPTNDDAD